MDPLGNLQASLYGLLADDDTLGVAVYDDVPEHSPGATETPDPYLTIGEGWTTPFDVHGTAGQDVTAMVHIWSWQAGFAEAQSILGRLLELLNHTVLEVDGYGACPVQVTGTQSLRDTNPKVRHIAVTCRVHLLPD